MKIGFDVAQTCSERAGCAWYADSLIRAMVARAPDHYYFLYHQFGDWINSDTETGTRIDSPQVTPTFLDVSPAEAGRIWTSPEELVVKTGAPDIVHANSFRAPRVPGAKLVFTVYDVSFWARPEYSTEDNRITCQQGLLDALGNADGFVFISQSARDEFERFLPGWMEANQKPWQVTPLATRHTDWVPVDNPSGDYWLAVGSLEPRKNYDTLLQAFVEYHARSSNPLPLKIAGGKGWKSESTRSRIAQLASEGIVEYLGYVPDEQLPELYGNARALVFPSHYEGFGLPPLEAMHCGCPVICSQNTSLREVGGDVARYIEPDDTNTIVEAMLELESCDDQPNLRQRSYDQAMTFNWDRTAEATLKFYSQVTACDKNNHI